MARVVVEDAEPDGLARMIAELVEANTRTHPAKERLIESARGAVQLDLPDAGVTVGMKFVPGTLTVTSGPVPGADLRVTVESATLMGLSTVPLRFGLPDALTDEGRALAAKAIRGRLKIRGLPRGWSMMVRLNRLLNVVE